MNFQTPSQDGYGHTNGQVHDLAAFLENNPPRALRPITSGSFSYSATRPVAFKEYFYDIFNTGCQFNCPIEGWHTEGGPGVYEAVSAMVVYYWTSTHSPGSESITSKRNGR